jgi:hypothetical protein
VKLWPDAGVTQCLDGKKKRYALAKVLEYLVICLQPAEIRWFDLREGTQLARCEDGLFKSSALPGLWIDDQALLAGNGQGILKQR